MSVLFAAEAGQGAVAFPILSMLVFVPVAGALVITVLSKHRREYVRARRRDHLGRHRRDERLVAHRVRR